jgi:hypothetical protein
MGTNQAAINPPSDVNIKSIRTVGGKIGLQSSPGRGEREDGSGSTTPKAR